MTIENPFEDQALVRDVLYRDPTRLGIRSSTLLTAKVAGRDVTDEIVARARGAVRTPEWVADIGCGRGRIAAALAKAFPRSNVCAIDVSSSLLGVVRRRHPTIATLASNFHRLPLRTESLDLAVLAFCLYHSPRPALVCEDVARALRPSREAIFATKAVGSYWEIDALIDRAALDVDVSARPSLYRTFSSENCSDLIAGSLDVIDLWHEENLFVFRTPRQLAQYIATSPKYPFVQRMRLEEVVARVSRVWPSGGLVTSSTVTICTARRNARAV